jgi:hypothetical protein
MAGSPSEPWRVSSESTTVAPEDIAIIDRLVEQGLVMQSNDRALAIQGMKAHVNIQWLTP